MDERYGFITQLRPSSKNQGKAALKQKFGMFTTKQQKNEQNQAALLTSDEDSDSEVFDTAIERIVTPVIAPVQKNGKWNHILDTASDDKKLTEDSNRTYCSSLEVRFSKTAHEVSLSEVHIPETSISGETTDKENEKKRKESLADTVVGCSMSMLSSQLSFIDINKVEDFRVSQLVVALTQNLADTQDMENFEIDTETNDYLKNNAWEIKKAKLANPVVSNISEEQEVDTSTSGGSADDDNNNNESYTSGTSESSLPLTISSTSEPEKPDNSKEKLDDSCESDVIVLDSDMSNPLIDQFSHLLPLRENDSFENCSSIAKTVSEDLHNEFFENVPDITSLENVVSHEAILKHREDAKSQNSQEDEDAESENRFKLKVTLDDDERANHELSIAESLEIIETQESKPLESQESERDLTVQNNINEMIESDQLIKSDKTFASKKTVPSQGPSTPSTPNTIRKRQEIINISAMLKINIHISTAESSDCSSTTSEDSGNPENSNIAESSAESGNEQAQKDQKIILSTSDKKKSETPHRSFKKDFNQSQIPGTSKQPSTPKVPKKIPGTPTSNRNLPKSVGTPVKPIRTPKKATPSSNVVDSPASEFKTPLPRSKQSTVGVEKVEIDSDMEKILNDIYGSNWKTPDMIKNCASKKFQNKLRQSILDNNFSIFHRNHPTELESTRISSDSSSVDDIPVKVSSPLVKTPRSAKTPKKPSTVFSPIKKIAFIKKPVEMPRYKKILDSDSESEASVRSDESWKNSDSSSSSEDEESPVKDVSKINKKSMSRVSHRVFHISEESDEDSDSIIHRVGDEKRRKEKQKEMLDKLDSFEFKKLPGLRTPQTDSKPKRKLFTHSHFADDFEDLSLDNDKEKENEKPKIQPKPFNKKLMEVQQTDGALFTIPKPAPITPIPKQKTLQIYDLPAPRTATKIKSTENITNTRINFGNYGFLQSLDVTLNKQFCHPEAVFYRENFKSKKEELTTKLYELFNAKVFENKLDIKIVWNKKLTQTAGRCHNSRKSGVRESSIDLSEKVLSSGDRLRCTLIHELCHAATWVFNGETGHGKTWKNWAAKSNRAFPELPKITVCHSYEIFFKFSYICTLCKAKYNTHSKSKKVDKIRCSICHGSIEVFLNKVSKDGKVIQTPVREATGFAKFVQDHYKDHKKIGVKHSEVMKLLSQAFKENVIEQ